ncbi:MAG: helix-turn-helix domain-containing protein [Bacteroidota bacterium]
MKTIQVRLYPNKRQKEILHQVMKADRFIYNLYVAEAMKADAKYDKLKALDEKAKYPK